MTGAFTRNSNVRQNMKKSIISILLVLSTIWMDPVIADGAPVEIRKVTPEVFKSSLLLPPRNVKNPIFVGFSADRAYVESHLNENNVIISWVKTEELDDWFVKVLKRQLRLKYSDTKETETGSNK